MSATSKRIKEINRPNPLTIKTSYYITRHVYPPGLWSEHLSTHKQFKKGLCPVYKWMGAAVSNFPGEQPEDQIFVYNNVFD